MIDYSKTALYLDKKEEFDKIHREIIHQVVNFISDVRLELEKLEVVPGVKYFDFYSDEANNNIYNRKNRLGDYEYIKPYEIPFRMGWFDEEDHLTITRTEDGFKISKVDQDDSYYDQEDTIKWDWMNKEPKEVAEKIIGYLRNLYKKRLRKAEETFAEIWSKEIEDELENQKRKEENEYLAYLRLKAKFGDR